MFLERSYTKKALELNPQFKKIVEHELMSCDKIDGYIKELEKRKYERN